MSDYPWGDVFPALSRGVLAMTSDRGNPPACAHSQDIGVILIHLPYYQAFALLLIGYALINRQA